MTSHRVPERPSCFLKVTLAKMVLAEVAVVVGPVARDRTGLDRSRRADRTVFLKEPLPPQQRSFGWDIPRHIVAIQTMTIQRLGQVYDRKPLIQADGEVNGFPDRQLIVVPADCLETTFPKERSRSGNVVTATQELSNAGRASHCRAILTDLV